MTNLNITPMPVLGHALPALGEQEDWLVVDDQGEDVHYRLTCGAGHGNTYVVLSVTRDGKTAHEVFDMRNLVVDWFMAMATSEVTP